MSFWMELAKFVPRLVQLPLTSSVANSNSSPKRMSCRSCARVIEHHYWKWNVGLGIWVFKNDTTKINPKQKQNTSKSVDNQVVRLLAYQQGILIDHFKAIVTKCWTTTKQESMLKPACSQDMLPSFLRKSNVRHELEEKLMAIRIA